MTKFEEELFNKVPCKFELTTEAEYKKSTLINHFKNWRPDEEFQELLSKYSVLNDNYEKEVIRSSKLETSNLKLISEGNGLLSDNATLTKEIVQLKSQLQQQALPVVPECVAKILIQYKGSNQPVYGLLKALELSKGTDIYNWIFSEGNQDIFALAFITGKYEVEKPQLFYLKHIDMSKRDKDNDYFAQIRNDRFEHNSVKSDTFPQPEIVGVRFTQSEIDSMQTGSYEKIEV